MLSNLYHIEFNFNLEQVGYFWKIKYLGNMRRVHIQSLKYIAIFQNF